MAMRALIVTTTGDFLMKFEQGNVQLLQELGYEVHYAANLHEPAYRCEEAAMEARGVQLHHVGMARSPYQAAMNWKALRQLVALLRRYRFDLIHCHTPVGGILARLAACLAPQPRPLVLYTAHGFHFYKGAPAIAHLVYAPVEKLMARLTDVLITINAEDYRAARRMHLRRGGPVYKIPGPGLDLQRFHPLSSAEKIAARLRLGIPLRSFFLVSVGEINGNKNHEIALQTLCHLRQTGHMPAGLRYAVLGDGFYKSRLKKQVHDLGLEDCVTLYGYRADVPSILGCADASFFPSRREGLGMAALESLAMGVPVIAADNRGTREYMQHEKNGYVYRTRDTDGFACAILALDALPPAKRRAMQRRCIQSAQPFAIRYARATMKRIYQLATQTLLTRNGETHETHHQHSHGRL